MRQKWGRRVMNTGCSRGNLKERDLFEELGESGRIMLKFSEIFSIA
jgi:hypothetical protein